MSIKVPDLIRALLNAKNGNPLYTQAKRIPELYDKLTINGKLTDEEILKWYTTSVKEDNFIKLFEADGSLASFNGTREAYRILVGSSTKSGGGLPNDDGTLQGDFGGKAYEDNGIKWLSFFDYVPPGRRDKILLTLLPFNNLIRYVDKIVVSEIAPRAAFEDLAYYTDQTDLSLGAAVSTEVLKAWSFYLSLRNNAAAIQKINQINIEQGAEDADRSATRAAVETYLDKRAKEGSAAADASVVESTALVNEAKAALDASTFNKQKYLIEKMNDIADFSELRDNVNINNSKSQILGIPQTRILKFTNSHKNAVNKIIGADKGRQMFKMPTSQLSKLVPQIRLFKVLYKKNMEKKGEIEIKFPTKFMGAENNKKEDLDPYEFVGSRTGYGIKSFSWEYKGSDPFSVDRDITATLELYFQSFSEFTKKREGGYRYVDLIVPLESGCQIESKSILGKDFQQDIRVVAGWEVPQSLETELNLANALPDEDERKKELVANFSEKIASIKASQVNFVLHPVDYNISFEGNANGASTITINYRARIESVGKNRLINVIGANKDEVKTIQYLEDKINNETIPEIIEIRRKQQQKLYKTIKSQASKRLISRLAKNKSIYWRFVNLEETMVSNFGKDKAEEYYATLKLEGTGRFNPQYRDGLQLTLSQLVAGAGKSIADKDLILIKEANSFPLINGSKPEKILYTFLGDIFQVALDIATDSGSFLGAPQDVINNFKVALLDFRVGEATYNLADLPIEMGIFTEFLNNKIGQRDEYTKSFISFARELISDVLINRIDVYQNLKDGTSRSFKIGYAQMNKNLEPASERLYNLTKRADIRTITKNPTEDFLVVYSDSPVPSDFEIPTADGGYQRAKDKDEANGLHHFSLGTTRSIVKNISFDRVDLEYARERRLTLNPEDPYALLSNVFNVNISMFGNNFFRPGSYIYVDPKIMGDLGRPFEEGSISNRMGLGGYHIVTSVSHTINLHSFETSLDAVWETSGDGKSSFTGLKKEKDARGKDKDCKKK